MIQINDPSWIAAFLTELRELSVKDKTGGK